MSRVIPRSEWKAKPPLKPPIRDRLPWSRLWLHHSAGSMGGAIVMRDIQRFHQSKGWRDIAYNLGIGLDGIYEGMGVGNRHLNSDAGNSGTLLLLGNFDVRPLPEGMIDRTAWVVAHGLLSGWWLGAADSGTPHITGGHRDIPGAKATLCPGKYAIQAIPEINRRAAKIIHTLGQTPLPVVIEEEEENQMWWILHDSQTGIPTSNMHYLIDEAAGEARVLKDPMPWISTADGGSNPQGFRKRSVPFAGRILENKVARGKYKIVEE